MASHLREGLVAKVPEATLDGEVEADEAADRPLKSLLRG